MYDHDLDKRRRERRKALYGKLYWFVHEQGGTFLITTKAEFAKKYDVRPADVEIMMSTFLDKGWAYVDRDLKIILNPIPEELMNEDKPKTLGQLLAENQTNQRMKLMRKTQQAIVQRCQDAISTGEWSTNILLEGDVYTYMMGMKSSLGINGGPSMRDELVAGRREDYSAFGQWLIDEDIDLSFDQEYLHVTYTLTLS